MGKIQPEKLKSGQLTNYIGWLQDPTKQHTVGVGNGKDRPPSLTLYVTPFNIALPPDTLAKAKASETAFNNLAGKTLAHVFNGLAPTQFAVGLKNYAAARLVYSQGKATKGKAKTSHITGDDYGSYGGTSQSIPFGAGSAATEKDELAVFELIKAQFEVNGVIPPGQSVSLIKEKFSQRSQ